MTVCVSVAILLWLSMSFATLSATIEVGVFDYFFEPFEVSINTGDTVAWTAYGYGHALVADSHEFDSTIIWPGTIPALRTFKHTFHEAGVYPYYSHEYGGPGGSGMSATIVVTGPVANQLPMRPINLAPTNGARNVVPDVVLRAGAYADNDAGDYHRSSQWTVRRDDGGELVYDSGEVIDDGQNRDSKTNRWLPVGRLEFGASYDWQVRYRDSFGGWSEYSAPTRFFTEPPLLRIDHQGAQVVLRWPANSAGFVLQQSAALTEMEWKSAVTAGWPMHIGGDCVVSNNVSGPERFYRLAKPPGG